MDNYLESYNKYEKTLLECIKLSQACAGIKSPTSSHFYASLLFTKICNCAESIGCLAPKPNLRGKNAHWDYSSVSSLTRDLIECYLTFYYFCIDECSNEEWDARWHLMNLHDHMSRVKMFDTLGVEYEDNEEAKEVRKEVIENLKTNKWFCKLPEKQQTHFLKGKHAFFKSQDEIVVASGSDVSYFRFQYIFTSNHTHSFPMSFYRMADGSRGCGVESRTEIEYTARCLDWVSEYLMKAKEGFASKFERKPENACT